MCSLCGNVSVLANLVIKFHEIWENLQDLAEFADGIWPVDFAEGDAVGGLSKAAQEMQWSLRKNVPHHRPGKAQVHTKGGPRRRPA